VHHLTHQQPVRYLAYELLVRMNSALSDRPDGEGLLQYKARITRPALCAGIGLTGCQNAFRSEVVATARLNALLVSAHLARTCSNYMEDLFEEMFRRFAYVALTPV
jgi:hypothetical protein